MFVGALASVVGGLRVVVRHSVFVAVGFCWLLVVWCRCVVDRLGWCVVHRLRWCMVCWGVDDRGVMHHRSRNHNSSMVNRSMVNCSMMYRSMVDCSVVDRGMMN